MKWHYRTIRHIDSTFPEDEPFETVHEFSYDEDGNGEYDGFTFSHSHAFSKTEAQLILSAYDFLPVVEVDEAKFKLDEYGFPDYTEYKWLNKKVVTSKE
jgi:hypothetical protein